MLVQCSEEPSVLSPHLRVPYVLTTIAMVNDMMGGYASSFSNQSCKTQANTSGLARAESTTWRSILALSCLQLPEASSF
eukprot:scaffold255394_cov50-Prasinocladus_malaysianus.AAC.1